MAERSIASNLSAQGSELPNVAWSLVTSTAAEAKGMRADSHIQCPEHFSDTLEFRAPDSVSVRHFSVPSEAASAKELTTSWFSP